MEQLEIVASKEEKGAASTDNKKKSAKNEKKKIATEKEYGGDKNGLVYKSGIPTLRASAHRVKFKIKNRKHDPKPLDRDGNETGTTWLPDELQKEKVFAYDRNLYDLNGAVIQMLRECDPDIVGTFETSHVAENSSELDEPTFRLEDFRVPVSSVWRSVNGGCCEDAQKYLSNRVATNEKFIKVFDKFVNEVILPDVKARLVQCGALESDAATCAFYYQRPPTLRLQPGPGKATVCVCIQVYLIIIFL